MALITANLKALFEMDNTVVSPASWVDEVAGIELTQLGSMSEPALRTGEEGTPTGAPYFNFGSSTAGLGSASLAGEDIPDGAEPRTMYVVVRFPTGSSAGNFNGVMYGTPTTRQAFGVVLSNTEKVLTDFWSASFATADSFNDDTWHVISVTFDGSGVVGYIDNVPLISGTPSTLNTVLSKLYINYKLSDGTGAIMDCAAAIIYAGEHTGPQLTEMFSYLNAKYITPGAAGDEVGGGALSSGAPVISGGAIGQTHGLQGASLPAGVPAISGGGLAQVHALQGASLATGSPTISGGALGAVSEIGGATLSTDAPAISGGGLGQTHQISGATLTAGVPFIAGSNLGQAHQLGGATVLSGVPALSEASVGQAHLLGGSSLTSGSPTITGGAVEPIDQVAGATVSTGAPAITGGGVGQLHVIAGTDLTGGTPAPSGGALAQLHLIAGTDMQAGAPVITGGTLSAGEDDFADLPRARAIWGLGQATATWGLTKARAIWRAG